MFSWLQLGSPDSRVVGLTEWRWLKMDFVCYCAWETFQKRGTAYFGTKYFWTIQKLKIICLKIYNQRPTHVSEQPSAFNFQLFQFNQLYSTHCHAFYDLQIESKIDYAPQDMLQYLCHQIVVAIHIPSRHHNCMHSSRTDRLATPFGNTSNSITSHRREHRPAPHHSTRSAALLRRDARWIRQRFPLYASLSFSS